VGKLISAFSTKISGTAAASSSACTTST
jgi:hypothetical protein